MTAREIASMWIIAVAAIFVIIWDYRNQVNMILANIVTPPRASANTVNYPPVSSDIGTNNPSPIAGNEFGPLATYGNSLTGDVQPQGPDASFGSVWDNLGA